MNETSRIQGWTICGAAGAAALIFVVGLLSGSYWALALPVAILTLFALGLVAWVGFTIATIQVEADLSPEVLATDADTSNADASSQSNAQPSAQSSASQSDTSAAGDAA